MGRGGGKLTNERDQEMGVREKGAGEELKVKDEA